MKQSYYLIVITFCLCAISIFGTSNHSLVNKIHTQTGSNTSSDNVNVNTEVQVIYPNPQTGVLNLLCSPTLHSPITVKAINTKDIVVKTIGSLVAEGIRNHQFIQFNIADLENGEYKMILTDVNGKSIIRKVMLQK